LGCRAGDCLYVDDREENLEAAGRMGMNTVMFNSRNSLYKGNMVTDFIQLKNTLI